MRAAWRHACEDELEAKGLAAVLSRAGVEAWVEAGPEGHWVLAADADAAEALLAKVARVYADREDKALGEQLDRTERRSQALLWGGAALLLAMLMSVLLD